MIVAKRKPFEEITGTCEPYTKVLNVGCGTCVAVCLAGGEREVELLSGELALARKVAGRPLQIDQLTVERQCDREYLAELDDSQDFVGGQFEYLRTGTTGSVTHNLLAGVEISQLNDEFTFVPKVLPDIDLFNPVETAVEPLFPFPGQAMSADATSKIIADTLKLGLGDVE